MRIDRHGQPFDARSILRLPPRTEYGRADHLTLSRNSAINPKPSLPHFAYKSRGAELCVTRKLPGTPEAVISGFLAGHPLGLAFSERLRG